MDGKAGPPPSAPSNNNPADESMVSDPGNDLARTEVNPTTSRTIEQTIITHSDRWKISVGTFDGRIQSMRGAAEFIRRFEEASNAGNWSNRIAISNFASILTKEACQWWRIHLAEHPVASQTWEEVRKAFKADFVKCPNRTDIQAQLDTLSQRKDEKIFFFYLRVQEVILIASRRETLTTRSTPEEKLVHAAYVKADQDAMDRAFFSGIREEFKEFMRLRSDVHRLPNLREKVRNLQEYEETLDTNRKSLPLNENEAKKKTGAKAEKTEENKTAIEKDVEELKKGINALLTKNGNKNRGRSNSRDRQGRGRRWNNWNNRDRSRDERNETRDGSRNRER